ncbi:Uncharacterised protein [Mycobacteroides abscessus subsp. abscessus]|nr:Uncharacterised protein [Mycobacteroides abscessus subsp. abscessus]
MVGIGPLGLERGVVSVAQRNLEVGDVAHERLPESDVPLIHRQGAVAVIATQ